MSLVQMGQTILHNEMQTCSHIEGKDKFLQPKIVNHNWKYDGRKTSLVDGNGLKKGDHYMKQDYKHAKKDKTQVGRMGNNVLDQLPTMQSWIIRENGFNSS